MKSWLIFKAKTVTKQIGFLTAPHLADLTADDRLVEPYLAEHGIQLRPVIWTDPDYCNLDASVMRSTWGYFQQTEAFNAFLRELQNQLIPVQNQVASMLVNMDKRYLLELQSQDYPVIPTVYLEPGQMFDRAFECSEDGSDIIVKPVVSASGFETHRLKAGEPWPESLSQLKCGLFVQPFCQSIQSEGEWSLIYFWGKFSHAVCKHPRKEGYLIHEEHGGTTSAAQAPQALFQVAEHLADALCQHYLYARLDFVRYGDRYCLMELELLEPALYLAHDSHAPQNFAQAIVEWIT